MKPAQYSRKKNGKKPRIQMIKIKAKQWVAGAGFAPHILPKAEHRGAALFQHFKSRF
jgi:hypothetical protein